MAMEKFRAPPLPVPSPTYDQQYMTQLIRVLGLYFTQLDSLTPNQANSYRADNFWGGLFTGYGRGLILPHIAASDSTDQYATATNTPTVVSFNTLDSGYGFTLNPPGSATIEYAGIYKITYSIQFINTDNSIHYATVWLRENGVDISNSATEFFIPARKSSSPGEVGYLSAYSEVTFLAQAGDVVELYWATNQAATSGGGAGVYLFHDIAITTPYVRPAVPSVLGSITFISALP